MKRGLPDNLKEEHNVGFKGTGQRPAPGGQGATAGVRDAAKTLQGFELLGFGTGGNWHHLKRLTSRNPEV